MKKVLILMICLICMVGCTSLDTDEALYKTITASEAYDIMNTRDDIVIVDVRTHEEYMSGHIKDAVNVPLDEIESSISIFVSDRNKTILVYCKSGNRSKQASEKLVSMGYSDVIDFGGISNWEYEIVTE